MTIFIFCGEVHYGYQSLNPKLGTLLQYTSKQLHQHGQHSLTEYESHLCSVTFRLYWCKIKNTIGLLLYVYQTNNRNRVEVPCSMSLHIQSDRLRPPLRSGGSSQQSAVVSCPRRDISQSLLKAALYGPVHNHVRTRSFCVLSSLSFFAFYFFLLWKKYIYFKTLNVLKLYRNVHCESEKMLTQCNFLLA